MTPAYAQGQLVRVSLRNQAGHVRTPRYLRGRVGRVARICGVYPDPERLAQGELGIPYRMLYRVAFPQRELWPGYAGAAADDLVADLYEHWLEPKDGT